MGTQHTSDRQRGPWLRIILLVGGALAAFAVVIVGWELLTEYMASDQFCGQSCHPVMAPQDTTKPIQPHARVHCETCHVAPGLGAFVASKLNGARELAVFVTNTYERPLPHPPKTMPDAEGACTKCHWPLVTFEDRARAYPDVAEDEANTLVQTFLAMRIRGTDDPPGETGAHWHVGNPVSYVALDVHEQEIPWVSVVRDGQEIVYRATDIDVSDEELAEAEPVVLDCLKCHSRPAHRFERPADVVDEMVAEGLLPADLPFLKREAARLLEAEYETEEAAVDAIGEGLTAFYRAEYPDLYAANEEAVLQTAERVQDVYRQTTFPVMNVDWRTYPDDLGHTNFPGCFRCHDGEHVAEDGRPITLNCTTCHSVPIVVREGAEVEPSIVSRFLGPRPPEPGSHREPDWFRVHRLRASQEACSGCHGPIAFGTDDSSFCANSACHARAWPGLGEREAFAHPVELVGAHQEAPCGGCHAQPTVPRLENCDECHDPPTEPHFGPDCAGCHSPVGWEEVPETVAADGPSIPHPLEGAEDCRSCHGLDREWPFPADHEDITNEACTQCHEPAPSEGDRIPHPLAGREDCLRCHDFDGIEPMPPDHAGRTDESCLLCHGVAESS